MEPLKEDIERVIDKLHEEARRNSAGTKAFAAIAREYALQIQAMREEGYSYIEICSAFEKEKLLPEKANTDSFRQACRRQRTRLAKKGAGPASSKATSSQAEKKAVEKIEKPEKTAPPQQAAVTQDPDAAALEKERLLRKIGGRKIETLNGTVTAFTDGGFEFD